MVSIVWWGAGAFLRPDVGGKLKISPAAWRGSKAADTHRSVREIAADPVSAHSRPIMLPVMCVQPPYTPPAALASLPPCLCPSSNTIQKRESCQRARIKPPIKRWLSHTQVMINGLYSLTQRRKENRERATDGSFQLITKAQ